MKRIITSHLFTDTSKGPEEQMKGQLLVEVLDEPGNGGANHDYRIYSEENNEADCRVKFQNGGIAEAVNGVTNEALLAIVKDRLESFQAGPFPDPHNGEAQRMIELALKALHNRTAERLARGVEGQQKK